jgi:hypothetical protein
MSRHLIEVSHKDEYFSCEKALRAVKARGSHFVTRADWGCLDGVHTAWLIADVEDRETALGIVPPEFRQEARVVELNRWTPEDITAMLEVLKPQEMPVPAKVRLHPMPV